MSVKGLTHLGKGLRSIGKCLTGILKSLTAPSKSLISRVNILVRIFKAVFICLKTLTEVARCLVLTGKDVTGSA